MTDTIDSHRRRSDGELRRRRLRQEARGGLNAMLLPELKQMAGGLGIKGAGA